jgi:CBS domain-containing protein
MEARHVMTSPVKTGSLDMSVRDVAKMLSENRISAVPIVDENGEMIGIVSEGDLIRRAEIDTQRQRSWLTSLFTNKVQLAEEYARAHARTIRSLMTREVVHVEPETPLSRIVWLLERHQIKRVPVLDQGRLVGIVTRNDLVRAIAASPQDTSRPLGDEQICAEIRKFLEGKPWTDSTLIDVSVSDGAVDLDGLVRSEAEREAIHAAAERIAGVRAIKDHLALKPLPNWI